MADLTCADLIHAETIMMFLCQSSKSSFCPQELRRWVSKPGLALILDHEDFAYERQRWQGSTENQVQS